MRKIEREMIEAIKARKNYKNDNTEVTSNARGIRVYLHSNLIAHIENSVLWVRDCEYLTKTTKSRLNAILNYFGFPTLYAKGGGGI